LLCFTLATGFVYLVKCRPEILFHDKSSPSTRYTLPKNKDLKSFGIDFPAKYKVHGIDVSHYQKDIDWQEVSSMKIKDISIDFVFIKATEDRHIKDKRFADNWQQAQKHGLIRGAYHYYRPNTPSKYQAQNFIAQVSLDKGDLPPVLDIEITGKYPIDNLRAGLQNWLNTIEKHYGLKPIIYSNHHFYKEHLEGYFDGYPLWIARYNVYTTGIENNKWLFWQHSQDGLVNGIAGRTDFNVFNGSMRDLKAICKP
jgi:lysozyme